MVQIQDGVNWNRLARNTRQKARTCCKLAKLQQQSEANTMENTGESALIQGWKGEGSQVGREIRSRKHHSFTNYLFI